MKKHTYGKCAVLVTCLCGLLAGLCGYLSYLLDKQSDLGKQLRARQSELENGLQDNKDFARWERQFKFETEGPVDLPGARSGGMTVAVHRHM